ncbi:MAG: chemotaxis response regulator protein-glutamate methylesterase [Deltaproteobacteria bacterium]|nr:chemotaxis response regulator protein-glutamate methylesterase [Deltaproteobacteria bacterium]
MSEPIRVLVVDDSALVRKLLTSLLSSDPEIEVVGTASEPFAARELIKTLNPHVLTLDVEMPRMDGVTFLRNLMRLRPMPVVMVSSLTERGADVTLEALSLGAVDYVAKPKLGLAEGLERLSDEIIAKVKIASKAKIRPRAQPTTAEPSLVAPRMSLRTTDRVIAIGASTGGTEAIAEILQQFPPDSPAVVITQHIPEGFSERFALRLNDLCAMSVKEARDGDPVIVGCAYVAPGNHHLRVVRSGARYLCKVTQEDPVNRHRPSVDVLFGSIAQHVGPNAVGVILTGMGADGADGLGLIRAAGSPTIAQDKESSVVWGMPGEATKRGNAMEVLPLDKIAKRVLTLATR